MLSQKYKYYFLLLLLGAAILAWWAVWEKEQEGEFKVVFFDVGQGDSIFIEDEAGHQILIDGGENSQVLEKLGKVLPFYDRTLDLVILTHPHKDHIAGLIEVLGKYKIDLVLYTGVEYASPYYQEFKELLRGKEITFAFPHTGQRVILADKSYLDILFPLSDITEEEPGNLNNTSVICRLVRGDKEYLLTGDAESEVEEELILNNVYLKSDILKVGHQGSKTSSGENFLKAVDPDIAIISVGENRYGHPHKVVLERLEDLDIEVLRTDEEGDIEY